MYNNNQYGQQHPNGHFNQAPPPQQIIIPPPVPGMGENYT